MTKRYDESIEVTSDPADPGAPVSFRWRGRRYVVDRRLDSWREGAEWWNDGGRRDREYFRVLARPAGAVSSGDIDADGSLVSTGAVYDVYRDRVGNTWRLTRIWD